MLVYGNSDRPFAASPFERDRGEGAGLGMSSNDISAPSIDDGSTITDPAGPSSSSSSSDRSSAPRSLQPKLVLFDARTGEKQEIDLSAASSVMTLDDYKRLNRKTTERGMVTGLLGGGVLTYLVKRFMPKARAPSRNALALTFIFSSSFISFSTSRALLVSEILSARARARQQAIDNGDLDPAESLSAEDGSSPFPSTSTFSGSSGSGFPAGSTSSRFPSPSSSPGSFGAERNGIGRERGGDMFPDPAVGGGDSPTSLGSPERYGQRYGSSAQPQAQAQGQGQGLGGVGQVGIGRRWNPPPARGSGTGGPNGQGVVGVGAGEGEMVDPYASGGSGI